MDELLDEITETRPCRYCREKDGECQRESRNVRMRHRAAPGLAGQVARTWEAVDRLDQLVGTLTEALPAGMRPAFGGGCSRSARRRGRAAGMSPRPASRGRSPRYGQRPPGGPPPATPTATPPAA